MLTAPVHSSGLLDSPSHPSEVPMVHSSEATKLMDAAKALRPRILADRERIEAGRRLPEDLARELARAGFFRIYLPAAYGGLDLTPLAATEIFEELARADASVAWCVWNGNKIGRASCRERVEIWGGAARW